MVVKIVFDVDDGLTDAQVVQRVRGMFAADGVYGPPEISELRAHTSGAVFERAIVIRDDDDDENA